MAQKKSSLLVIAWPVRVTKASLINCSRACLSVWDGDFQQVRFGMAFHKNGSPSWSPLFGWWIKQLLSLSFWFRSQWVLL